MIYAATGHRPNKLGGYSVAARDKLFNVAYNYLGVTPAAGVITGMALGWDQAWALAALARGIPVHAAVPFAGQESQWPADSQRQFIDILARCASVTIVCEGSYSPHKMQLRNEWMVERCHVLVALWDGSSGGTGNCVRYAENYPRHIVNLWGSFSS